MSAEMALELHALSGMRRTRVVKQKVAHATQATAASSRQAGLSSYFSAFTPAPMAASPSPVAASPSPVAAADTTPTTAPAPAAPTSAPATSPAAPPAAPADPCSIGRDGDGRVCWARELELSRFQSGSHGFYAVVQISYWFMVIFARLPPYHPPPHQPGSQSYLAPQQSDSPPGSVKAAKKQLRGLRAAQIIPGQEPSALAARAQQIDGLECERSTSASVNSGSMASGRAREPVQSGS